jgi:hypothetical protein
MARGRTSSAFAPARVAGPGYAPGEHHVRDIPHRQAEAELQPSPVRLTFKGTHWQQLKA